MTSIHPSFPLPAVELKTCTGCRDCSGMRRLPHFLSKCKCIWWQCSGQYSITQPHMHLVKFALLEERRYQLTIIYGVIAWVLLAEGFGLFCLGASLSAPVQVVQWFYWNSLTCIYIKNKPHSKIRVFNLLNMQELSSPLLVSKSASLGEICVTLYPYWVPWDTSAEPAQGQGGCQNIIWVAPGWKVS